MPAKRVKPIIDRCSMPSATPRVCPVTDREYIEERVWRDGFSGCWHWTLSKTDKGYGQAHRDGKTKRAHRVSYEAFVGPVPIGLQLDHLCRNRACANPAHLEPVTQRENILRGVAPSAQNARKTHCEQGHEFTAANTYIHTGGKRRCRACHRKRERVRIQEKRRQETNSDE